MYLTEASHILDELTGSKQEAAVTLQRALSMVMHERDGLRIRVILLEERFASARHALETIENIGAEEMPDDPIASKMFDVANKWLEKDDEIPETPNG